MAYIHTPASVTASMQRGLGARRQVGRRLVTPRGEFAPGVDGLDGLFDVAVSVPSTAQNIAAIVGAVTAVGAAGAGLYFGRKDAKEAKSTADRQEQMAAAESKRAAAMQDEQLRIQKATEFAKAGLDETGRPIPGITGVAARIPGGWLTIGGAGVAVIGLAVFLIMRRRRKAA